TLSPAQAATQCSIIGTCRWRAKEACRGHSIQPSPGQGNFMSKLLSPVTLRGLTLRNRTVVAPMCQYSSIDGFANDWHFVHLGRFAMGGFGLVIVEATGVVAEGRISYGDMGLWKDEQIAPLARIVDFLHSQGAAAGIQLAHAGRKASTPVSWRGPDDLATEEQRKIGRPHV